MGTVIGYKGTPKERRENWLLMLFLRKSIAWTKEQPRELFRSCLQKETEAYKEIYSDYTKAA